MSYESPIEMFTEQVSYDWSEKTDDLVMKAVMNVGVEVDKNELVKALAYDRDQYDKGFDDGFNEATRGKWILTSERLPKDKTSFIATITTKFLTRVTMATRIGDEYFEGGERLYFGAIKAWMSLPEPYEEVVE